MKNALEITLLFFMLNFTGFRFRIRNKKYRQLDHKLSQISICSLP